MVSIRQFILNNDKSYVMLDWFASVLSFLTIMLVYRASGNLSILGNSGWLLNLITTALFISAAAQYFTMLNGKKVWQTYFIFLPVVVAEIIFLNLLVNGMDHFFISCILLLNVFFSAYRGHLMGTGRLPQAAVWNMSEQFFRITVLSVFLFIFNFKPGVGLLYSILITYGCFTFVVFVVTYLQKETQVFTFKKADLFDAILFTVVHMGIYVISTIDVLALKNISQPLKGEFILLKPWGQILYVAAIPFINVYLSRLISGERGQKILYMLAGFSLLYACFAVTAGDFVSRLVFQHSVESRISLFFVIVEHVLLAFILVLFYRFLHHKKGIGLILTITLCSVASIISVAYVLEGIAVYIGFVVTYATALSVLLSLFLVGEKSSVG